MNLSVFSRNFALVLLISATIAGSSVVGATVVADFSLDVSPGQQTVPAGSTTALNMTVTSIGNFQGSIAVRVYSESFGCCSHYSGPLIAGLPHNFTLTAGASSRYNVTVQTRIEDAGILTVIFQGSNGTISHNTGVTITILPVPYFTVCPGPLQSDGFYGCSCSPFLCSVDIGAGASKKVAVNVESHNNFTGAVVLSASSRYAGREQLAFGFDPVMVTLAANNTASSSLTISVPSDALYGGYVVFVNGTSGGVAQSAVMTVFIPVEFSLTPRISPLSITAGSSGFTSVMLVTNGFRLTVDISVSAPSGLTASLSEDKANVNATVRVFNFTLTVSVSPLAPPGKYYLNLTAGTDFPGGGGIDTTFRSTRIPVVVAQIPPSPDSILGLEPVVFYRLLGSLAAIGVMTLGLVFLSRKRSSHLHQSQTR